MSQFDLDAKARDIGLEGFNAPAELNALHVWQLAGRKATIRLKRDREFADSPVEEIGFELVVPCGEPVRTNELSSHHNCGGRSELSPNLMRDERLQFLLQHRRDPG